MLYLDRGTVADPLRDLLKMLVYSHSATVDSLTDIQVFQILSAAACLIIIFLFITKSYLVDYTARFMVLRNNLLFPRGGRIIHEAVPDWSWHLLVMGITGLITYFGICQMWALNEVEDAL